MSGNSRELAEQLDPGLALHADTRGGFLATSAVVFEAIDGALQFDDVRLLRIDILLRGVRHWGNALGDSGGSEKEKNGK